MRSPSRQRIDVYDTESNTFEQPLIVTDLSDDPDVRSGLAACVVNRRLFICDSDEDSIFKVELDRDNDIQKSGAFDRPGGVSVNGACNLLVWYYFACEIVEYTPVGEAICAISLQLTVIQLSPEHSIELTTSRLVVCGRALRLVGRNVYNDIFDINVMNEGKGKDRKTSVTEYKSQSQSATSYEFSYARRLAVDVNKQHIFVIDFDKDKVVAFRRSLQSLEYRYVTEISTTSSGGKLYTPLCLYLNSSRELYIGEDVISDRYNRPVHGGRICVFSISDNFVLHVLDNSALFSCQ